MQTHHQKKNTKQTKKIIHRDINVMLLHVIAIISIVIEFSYDVDNPFIVFHHVKLNANLLI